MWKKNRNIYYSDLVQKRNKSMRILSVFKTFCKKTKCFKYRENIFKNLFWIKASTRKSLIEGWIMCFLSLKCGIFDGNIEYAVVLCFVDYKSLY